MPTIPAVRFLQSLSLVVACSLVTAAPVHGQVDTSVKAKVKVKADTARSTTKVESKITARDVKDAKVMHDMKDMKMDSKMDHKTGHTMDAKMDARMEAKMEGKMDAKMEAKKEGKMGSTDMKKMMEGEHASSGWKELDAYHQLMMAAWHPVMEKGDLAPARAKAADMSASAKVWSESKAPAGCDAPELNRALGDVVKGSNSLAQLVAQFASDSTVKSEIAALHKRFGVLEMGCKPAKPAKQ